jgi:hypothetical protein
MLTSNNTHGILISYHRPNSSVIWPHQLPSDHQVRQAMDVLFGYMQSDAFPGHFAVELIDDNMGNLRVYNDPTSEEYEIMDFLTRKYPLEQEIVRIYLEDNYCDYSMSTF